MSKTHHRYFLSAALLSALWGCDATDDAQVLRQKLADGLAQATVPLADAIATAESEGAGVAIEAELEVEHAALVYSVDVIAADGLHRVDIDPESGAVVRNRLKDTAEAEETAAATFATGADWAALIATAEAHVSGETFEIEVDDGHFEAKLLAGDVVWEIDLSAAGEIVKSEQNDDFDGDDDGGDDDLEDDDEDEDDDHHGGDDDEDDADEDEDDADEDEDEDTDEDEGEDDDDGPDADEDTDA